MHPNETVVLPVFAEMVFEELFLIRLVHFGIEISDRVCQRAAKSFDLLKSQIRIKVDDVGFQMLWLVRLRCDGKDALFYDGFAAYGVCGDLFCVHFEASIVLILLLLLLLFLLLFSTVHYTIFFCKKPVKFAQKLPIFYHGSCTGRSGAAVFGEKG